MSAPEHTVTSRLSDLCVRSSGIKFSSLVYLVTEAPRNLYLSAKAVSPHGLCGEGQQHETS